MTRQKRWVSIFLVLCLMMTLVPATARAEGEGKDTIDFVLMVDCSNTMIENDPESLAKDACKMFVDLIPVQDARVAIIAFGYEKGSDAYQYTQFQVKKGKDANFVHQISTMQGQLNSEKKDVIKDSIDALGGVDGQLTPVGAALAAGVDLLQGSGTTRSNGCLILMTDGERTSTELGQDAAFTDQALATAKSNDWPVYCIEMDYRDSNEADGSAARKLLNRIVTESGAGEGGRMKVGSPAQVAEAFMKIFKIMWGNQTDVISDVLNEDGIIEMEFEVPKLTSEVTIAISSDSVHTIELSHAASGYTGTFDSDLERGNLIVTKEDSYISVKMICPIASGDWKVKVYGDPNAEIVVYTGIVEEMNLAMTATPMNGADPNALTKNDFVEVKAWYTYNGNDLLNDDVYESGANNIPAQLVITDANGNAKRVTMTGTQEAGYYYKLDVSDAPSGKFTLSVLVEYSRFRDGKEESNRISFQAEDLPLIHHEDVAVDLHSYVNGTFDKVDLNTIFESQDGDPIDYDFYCTSDRNVVFGYEIDDNGYMTIQGSMVPGTHTMELTAKESHTNQLLAHPVTLTVEDRPIEATGSIPAQELWTDYFEFLFLKQTPGALESTIDLNSYFVDPDGAELTYANLSADGELVQAQLSGSQVRLVPTAVGTTTVTVEVSDGVGTVTAQIPVEIISGVDLFWEENIKFVYIAIFLLIVLILFALFVRKNTKVKGKWDVTLKYRNQVITTRNPADPDDSAIRFHVLGCTRGKKQIKLKALLTECMEYSNNPGSGAMLLDEYFLVPGANDLTIKGVFRGNGFVLENIKTGEDLEIDLNGSSVDGKKKSIKVLGGELRIGLRRTDPGTGIKQLLEIWIEANNG